MASNQDNSKKSKRGPAQPWVVNSFGVSSPSSSKPPKQQQRTLMSAPAFAISPRTGSGGGGSRTTRAQHDGDQAETPVKKIRREEDGDIAGTENDDSANTDLRTTAGSSSSTRPHPLAQPTPLLERRLPPSKPLTTTPSRHLPPPPPPPPAYRLSRPPPAGAGPSTVSPNPSKPLSRISDLLPAPLAPSPIKCEPSPGADIKKKPLTVGLSGVATAKVRVGEEEGGEGGTGGLMGLMGVDEWAMGMLSGKSPSKGKKAFKGILPLTSSTSLLLISHSTSLKHFFTSSNVRRPPPDLHLLILSVAPPLDPPSSSSSFSSHAQLNLRLLRTTCRILPSLKPTTTSSSPRPPATTTSTDLNSDPFALPPPPPPPPPTDVEHPTSTRPEQKDEEAEMKEEESIGTVLLMLPADGSLGVGRKEGVGVGKTVRGWRPWLEVEVEGEEGGERVLMLDRFEFE